MFGIGSTELLIIFVVALVVLGPKSIPQIAKTIGKAMGEFRRVSTEFQRTMNVEAEMDDHEKRKKEAEEELFGGQDDSEPKKSKGNLSSGKKSAQAKESKPAEKDLDSQDNAKVAESVDNSPADNPENVVTIDTTAKDSSPLAEAVKKAEAEANSYAEAKEIAKGDNAAKTNDIPKDAQKKSEDIA